MTISTFQGTVKNGQVELPEGTRLPEKARVYVVVPDLEDEAASRPKFDLAEMAARMPSDYCVAEEDFGLPVGKEEW